jgi:hypothetical protein
MNAPPEFHRFAVLFHQDIDLTARTDAEMIGLALKGLDRDERNKLRNFLTVLEASAPSTEELQELWRSTKADRGPEGEGIHSFFRMVRSMA